MGRDGEHQGNGIAIIRVSKETVLRRCLDDKWCEDHFSDAHIMGVEFDFASNCFQFQVRSSAVLPVPDGHTYPILLARPRLGNPPEFILREKITEALRRFRQALQHTNIDAKVIHELDGWITEYEAGRIIQYDR